MVLFLKFYKRLSYNYLLKKGYLDGDEYFSYGFNGNIVLSAKEFREFVELYNEDYNEEKTYIEKDWFINSEEIKELLEDDSQKLIQWY